MEVRTASRSVYDYFKKQMFELHEGDTLKLTPPYAHALDVNVLQYKVNIHGERFFYGNLVGSDRSIVIEVFHNCMNIATYKDNECLKNKLYLIDDAKSQIIGIKNSRFMWGFDKKLIPESVSVTLLRSANDYPREDYGINSIAWHPNGEVILPLYDEATRSLYLSEAQRKVLEENPDINIFSLRKGDKIYELKTSDFREITTLSQDQIIAVEQFNEKLCKLERIRVDNDFDHNGINDSFDTDRDGRYDSQEIDEAENRDNNHNGIPDSEEAELIEEAI